MKTTLLPILLLFCVAVSAQSPNYKIAFNVLQDQKTDDYEVYTIDSNGTGIKNVTNNKDVAWTYYSIPGKLLFISDRGACKRCYFMYESDIDGNNPRKISDLQLEDSWMGSRNSGKELIVAGRVATTLRFQLFTINRATGTYKQLTNEPAAAFRDPTFSPDGKRIVYVYKKNRTDRSEIEEMYIMNADSTGRKKLTHTPLTIRSGKSQATRSALHIGTRKKNSSPTNRIRRENKASTP